MLLCWYFVSDFIHCIVDFYNHSINHLNSIQFVYVLVRLILLHLWDVRS